MPPQIIFGRELESLRLQALNWARHEWIILITGETGAGKEMFARFIHENSPRRAGPFVSINCANLSESLLESELFGHRKGAFSGAIDDRPGLIQQAALGTAFIDEMGELPSGLQAKTLHLLDKGLFRPVGCDQMLNSQCRIILATNRAIPAMVMAGTMRSDLYYRINGFELRVPPLRERRDDIVELARAFIAQVSTEIQRPPCRLTSFAEERLRRYSWPGNVRELRHYAERWCTDFPGQELTPMMMGPSFRGGTEQLSRRMIEELRRKNRGMCHSPKYPHFLADKS